jgi:hypothetical protein
LRKQEQTAIAGWLALTLGIGAALAVWKPWLLIPWLIPGVPPPGPIGGQDNLRGPRRRN